LIGALLASAIHAALFGRFLAPMLAS